MGCFLLMGSTATIDTGKMNNDWHVSCASSFFIFTLAAQFLNTIVSWVVYTKIGALNKWVLYFKTFLIGLLVLQLYISTVYGESKLVSFGQNLGNDWDKAIEWTLTVTVLAGFYAMALDVSKF